MQDKKEYYSSTQLSSFFDFLKEEGERMEKEDIRLLLSGFELLLAQNLPALSLRDVESLLQEIRNFESEHAIREKEEIHESVPLSALELSKIPGRIREEMRKGEFTAETLETLISGFERELEKSSSKITLTQSYQLHRETDNLRQEFKKRE